jgi:antibiotic biosynthesis monooxygenase (ABM) superfamily enzyme
VFTSNVAVGNVMAVVSSLNATGMYLVFSVCHVLLFLFFFFPSLYLVHSFWVC